ncbi:MAG: type II secretion system protein GspM [Bacillota bacterium]
MARQKAFLSWEALTIILGVLALGCMLFLIFVQVNALRAAQDAAAGEKAALARDQARLQQLSRLKEQAPLLRAQLARAERLLPAAPAEAALLNDIKDAANKSGARVVQIRFENRAAKQGYVEMPLKVTFEGRYQGLLNLLAELRAGPRALRVDGVKIGKGEQELPSIKAEITASAFYKTAGAAPGSTQ